MWSRETGREKVAQKSNLGKYIQETSLLRFLTSEELGYNDLKET